MSDTILYCDRDDAIRLSREEANAVESKQTDPVEEEAENATLADEIAALREEMQNALTFLKSDLRSYILAAEPSLSGKGDEYEQ